MFTILHNVMKNNYTGFNHIKPKTNKTCNNKLMCYGDDYLQNHVYVRSSKGEAR